MWDHESWENLVEVLKTTSTFFTIYIRLIVWSARLLFCITLTSGVYDNVYTISLNTFSLSFQSQCKIKKLYHVGNGENSSDLHKDEFNELCVCNSWFLMEFYCACFNDAVNWVDGSCRQIQSLNRGTYLFMVATAQEF